MKLFVLVLITMLTSCSRFTAHVQQDARLVSYKWMNRGEYRLTAVLDCGDTVRLKYTKIQMARTGLQVGCTYTLGFDTSGRNVFYLVTVKRK
jgi:hypothetical protein